MEKVTHLDDNWGVLQTMFPANWRELARETEAMVRKLRSFKDVDSVMRTLLLHIANGYSLREAVTRAKISQLADVTDVSLLKRLQCSEGWFKALSLSLLKERGMSAEKATPADIQIRIVDGTIVKEPGKTGSKWRIHYSLKLPDLQCDYFKLTSYEGALTGESFKQFQVNKGDCIIGDKGYSTAQGIAYLAEREAYSLVRVNSSALQFYAADGEINFNLFDAVTGLKAETLLNEWNVSIKDPDYGLVSGRICIMRKSQVVD